MVESDKGLIEILTIEGVTVTGCLIVVIIFLLYHIKSIKKDCCAERELLREEVKSARHELRTEYNKGTTEMKNIAEKYYIISTKVLEHLRNKI